MLGGIALSKDASRPSLQHCLKDSKRWERQGKSKIYTLKRFDPEEDKQYFSAQITKTSAPNGKAFDPDDKLKIAGIANANIIDRMEEVLDPRGLDVKDYLKNPQLLAHHSYFLPVGQLDLIEAQDDGVHFAGWVGDPRAAPLTAMQIEMRSLIAQRIIKAVSVGFIPLKIREAEFSENGELVTPLTILLWALLELSLVAVPANQDSLFEMRAYEIMERSGMGEAFQKLLSNQPKGDNAVTDPRGKNNKPGKKDDHDDDSEHEEDNGDENTMKEVLNVVRNNGQILSRVAESIERLVSKLLEDKGGHEDEEEEEDDKGSKPKPEDEEEDKKAMEKELKELQKTVEALAKRTEGLEKGFSDVVSTLALLTEQEK